MDVVDTGFVTLTVGPKPMIMIGTVNGIYGGTAIGNVAYFVIGGLACVKLQFTELFSMMVEADAFVDPINGIFLWDGGLSFNFTF